MQTIKNVLIALLVIINVAAIAYALYLYGYRTGSRDQLIRDRQEIYKFFERGIQPNKASYIGEDWLISEFS